MTDQTIQQRRRPSRRVLSIGRQGLALIAIGVFGAAALIGTVGLVSAAGSADTSHELPERLLPVNTIRVTRQEAYMVSHSFVGRIEAARSSELGFEIGGLVTRLTVDEGDAIEQDQLLAELDTARLGARRREVLALRRQAAAQLEELENGPREEVIAAARAEVERSEAQLELATLTRERMARAYAKEAASDHEWDEARLEVDALSAGLRSVQERLRELETGTRREQIEAQKAVVEHYDAEIASVEVDIEKSRLQAPFSGTISARFVDEGRVVDAGRPVVRLLESNRLEVRIGVSAAAAGELSIGETLPVDVGGVALEGRIRTILPERASQTRTVTVILTLTATARDVRSGDVARIQVDSTVEGSGTWLPTTALLESRRGLWGCFVAVPDLSRDGQRAYRIEKHQLDVVHAERERVFVRGTLGDGDRVVVDGVHRLVPGQLVQLSNQETE